MGWAALLRGKWEGLHHYGVSERGYTTKGVSGRGYHYGVSGRGYTTLGYVGVSYKFQPQEHLELPCRTRMILKPVF